MRNTYCCRWVTVDLVEGAVDKPIGVEAHCSKYCSMNIVFWDMQMTFPVLGLSCMCLVWRMGF